MDVWTINEKLKTVSSDYKSLEARLKHVEEYLSELSRKNTKDEVVQNKKSKSSGVRNTRRATKKS